MAKKKKKIPKKMKKKSTNIGKKDIMKAPLPKIPYNQDIPVYDFLEDHDLDTDWGIGECLANLIYSIEGGYFLRWEALVCDEQRLPLTQKQQEALDELISFSDNDELILYIDEMPRPKEPWYETIKKVVSKLILDPFETYKIYNEIYHEEWPRLVECLEEYAKDLSLPKGITSPLEVIPAEISHRLWLQYCFDVLSGLGQEKELTLENENQKSWRIEEFIDTLKECKDSVKYYNLTIEKLFKLVKLPPKDEKILVKSMLEKLGMESVSEKLYDVL